MTLLSLGLTDFSRRAFLHFTSVSPCHMWALPSLYHWMQFLRPHRMRIFSNFLSNYNNETRLSLLTNSLFFHLFFENLIRKNVFKIFLYKQWCRSRRAPSNQARVSTKKSYSIFESHAFYTSLRTHPQTNYFFL